MIRHYCSTQHPSCWNDFHFCQKKKGKNSPLSHIRKNIEKNFGFLIEVIITCESESEGAKEKNETWCRTPGYTWWLHFLWYPGAYWNPLTCSNLLLGANFKCLLTPWREFAAPYWYHDALCDATTLWNRWKYPPPLVPILLDAADNAKKNTTFSFKCPDCPLSIFLSYKIQACVLKFYQELVFFEFIVMKRKWTRFSNGTIKLKDKRSSNFECETDFNSLVAIVNFSSQELKAVTIKCNYR